MILVTGGGGYIGSHCIKLLMERGIDAASLDNFERGHREAISCPASFELDLRDRERVFQIFRSLEVEGIIHFAAYCDNTESVVRPDIYFRNNIFGSLNLLDAAIEGGAMWFIHSSSCSVYGIPPMEAVEGITEEVPLNPITPYGISKLVVEKVLESYGRAYGLKWVSLRYFNAAGASPDGEIGESHDPENHLIPAVLGALKKGGVFTLYGDDYPTPDGTCIRDYIHVTDLSTAHLFAMNHLKEGGESMAFNVGTGRGHSVREVIAACEKIAGRRARIDVAGRRVGDPPCLVASCHRIREVLKFEPRYMELEDMVETAWNWELRRRY